MVRRRHACLPGGASEYIAIVQRRQPQLVASPEEIAQAASWISLAALCEQANRLGNTDYGRMLGAVADDQSARTGG